MKRISKRRRVLKGSKAKNKVDPSKPTKHFVICGCGVEGLEVDINVVKITCWRCTANIGYASWKEVDDLRAQRESSKGKGRGRPKGSKNKKAEE